MHLDRERLMKASADLLISGVVKSQHERLRLIEEAISAIQADPLAFESQYLGIKNYAHFGDQRHDCEYGMGPRHGSIVFQIGRRMHGSRAELGADHIYLLQAVRDSGEFEVQSKREPWKTETVNLQSALIALHQAQEYVNRLDTALLRAQVET